MASFYQILKEELTSILLKLFFKIMKEEAIFLNSFYEARNTVGPNPDKDIVRNKQTNKNNKY